MESAAKRSHQHSTQLSARSRYQHESSKQDSRKNVTRYFRRFCWPFRRPPHSRLEPWSHAKVRPPCARWELAYVKFIVLRVRQTDPTRQNRSVSIPIRSVRCLPKQQPSPPYLSPCRYLLSRYCRQQIPPGTTKTSTTAVATTCEGDHSEMNWVRSCLLLVQRGLGRCTRAETMWNFGRLKIALESSSSFSDPCVCTVCTVQSLPVVEHNDKYLVVENTLLAACRRRT